MCMNPVTPAAMNRDLNLREHITPLTARIIDRVDKQALRHWSFHVSVSALPSFVFAVSTSWKHPQSICGMLLGVVFFIALYSALARWTFPSEVSYSLWRRALRLGTWIRTVWAMVALIGVAGSAPGGKWFAVLFIPDMWAGILACALTQRIAGLPLVRWLRDVIAGTDATSRATDPFVGSMASLLPTFLITVVEGFILSAAMFVIALVCLGIFRLITRRQPASA